MHLKATLLSALLASTASAAVAGTKHKVFSCGTKEPSAEHIKILQNFALQEKAFAAAGGISTAAAISVDVYFHVVVSSTAEADGYVTDTQLANQLTAMNTAYAPYGISFVLKGTDRTINAKWASDGSELAMKKALRKGTYRPVPEPVLPQGSRRRPRLLLPPHLRPLRQHRLLPRRLQHPRRCCPRR